MSSLKLSTVHPDFENLLLQLQLFLRQKATWLDTVESGAGQTLLEAVAAIGEFNQAGIELAYREAFLETANRASSIYAITRMLGVRISRKTPASVACSLTRELLPTSYTLKAYTQFDINGNKYFNREPIVFPANSQQLSCTLYQGEVKTFSLVSNATQFREIYLPEKDFVVSDLDVVVDIVNFSTNSTERWNNTYEGIWASSEKDKVFYDTTSAEGNAVIMLGDGVHGVLPSVGTSINITYVVTLGVDGNNGVLSQPIKALNTDQKIVGSTLGSSGGGDNQKGASHYKKLAPYIFKAKNRAVTKNDYTVISLDYPGVASVVVHSQRDIAPQDLRWMNVVRICILPKDSDTFNQSQWDDFQNYFKRFKHYAIDIQQFNPTKIPRDLYLKVAMKSNQIDSVVKAECIKNLNALFDKTGTLGKRKSLSDISDACIATGKVDYVNILQPTNDLICPTPYSWFSLQNLTLDLFYSERS